MDLDDFKPINDLYGHACGDAVLVDVCERIQHSLRPQDLLARWGGDEFVVMLPQAGLGEAREAALRIRQVMNRLQPVGNHRLTLSYGVVQWQEGENPHALLARADQALYRAKAAGKNGVAE